MAQKKLVSVRLNAGDLQVIDDWAKKARCQKRSDVVDAAVRLAAWMIRNGHSQKLMRFWPKWDTVVDFKLEYQRDNLLITPKQ